MNSQAILSDLIAFPTVSVDPNRALIDYCDDILRSAGAHTVIVEDETGKKANLYATLGRLDRPGVMLSGHTDVVPVEGQNWTVPPFEMTQDEGRLYGRGATDMKGFVASALAMALRVDAGDLRTPLHIALSYDEEIGCVGVRSMIEMLERAPVKPRFCIVGEPTSMAVATGHKGKTGCVARCVGQEGHSALAPMALNAIHLACDAIGVLREVQDRVRENSVHDADYDVPYTTVHVGVIEGGTALNIVPNACSFRFEIRNLLGDDPEVLLAEIRAAFERIVAPHRARFPQADIAVEVINRYPPLGTAPDAQVVAFVKSLTGANGTLKVAFGTEGGLFDQVLGIPTVVCGPGSMDQGHKPDEFITLEQLGKCDAMLEALRERLVEGI